MSISTTPPPDPSAEGDELATSKKLATVHEELASLPVEQIGSDDLDAIVCAIRENRLDDAIDLIDVTRELASAPVLPEEVEAPDMVAARVWRYDWGVAERRGRPRLTSIDSHRCVELQAAQQLSVDADRWVGRVGELPAFGRGVLDLGLKGELILVLFAGELTIADEDGEEKAQLSAGPDGYAAKHIVFCRVQHNPEAVKLYFTAHEGEPVRGLWCLSTASEALTASERDEDPHTNDLLLVRDLLRFGDESASGGAFCAGAESSPTEGYDHWELVEQGALDRYMLGQDGFATNDGWKIKAPEESTAVVTGIQAGKKDIEASKSLRRQLKSHGHGLEVLVALRGITWVTVSNEKYRARETKKSYVFSDDINEKGWVPAHVTGLVAPGTSGHDVMLLNAGYYHTAWTTPGSDARAFHLFFPDPREIQFERVGGGHATARVPLVEPRRVAPDGSKGPRATAAPEDDRRWQRVRAVAEHAAEPTVVAGPWQAEGHRSPRLKRVGKVIAA